MRQTYKNILMWALYAVLFLFVVVLQTVVFGRARFFGVKLSLVPVCIACIAMHTGSENGALFGLIAGAFWMLAGADGGALYILLFTGCGAVVGYLCDRYLNRTLLSAFLMSLLTLSLTQTALFAFRVFLGTTSWAGILSVPVQIGLSMLAWPLIYPAAWAVRKAGA